MALSPAKALAGELRQTAAGSRVPGLRDSVSEAAMVCVAPPPTTLPSLVAPLDGTPPAL